MPSVSKQPTISPELEAEYQSHVALHASCQLNVGTDLDTYAKRHGGQLRRLHIKYPRRGSAKERWIALRPAFSENKIRGLLKGVRAGLEALTNGHQPSSNPDELEKVIATAARGNPGLEPFIIQAQLVIREFRERVLDLR